MVIQYRSLPERVLKVHNKTAKNYEWVRKNWDTLSKDFMGQFIAVSDCEVVFNTTNYRDLLGFLSENRDRADIVAVRMRENDKVLLL